MKERLYEILESKSDNSLVSKIVNLTIFSLIILTVIAIVLQSFQEINDQFSSYFYIFEVVSVIIFSIEYLARVYVSNLRPVKHKSRFKRIRYMLTPMALIDLMAILPFFLPFIIPIDLRFLRVLRFARLLRLFKLNRYTKALTTISKVIKGRRDELISSSVIMFLVLLIASILMYYAEFEAQPEAFSNIGTSFWWAICTLTTVGYGDIYPITIFGKIIASVITILGIGLIALPTAIISTGFLEEFQKKHQKKCPHCGKRLDD